MTRSTMVLALLASSATDKDKKAEGDKGKAATADVKTKAGAVKTPEGDAKTPEGDAKAPTPGS